MTTMAATVEPAAARLLPNPARASRADTLEEARELVSRNIYPHRLHLEDRSRAVPRLLTCVTSVLDLGDCALGYVQYGHNVIIDSGIISEYLLVKSTVAGHGRVTCGNHTVVSTPRSIIMTSMTERSTILMTAECRHLTARISRQALEARLSEKLGRKLSAPLRFGPEVASDSGFGRGWHQLLVHLCELSASAPGVLAAEAVRRQYSRTLIEMLIHSAPHNYTQLLEESSSQSIPWHVRRARDYIHNHLPDIGSVADIAACIGITVRTLQNGFRQAFDMTPAEYVRRVRVQALHEALLASAGSGQSVTELMQGIGIVNFGRYARYYREQIGVPPSVTLKRAL